MGGKITCAIGGGGMAQNEMQRVQLPPIGIAEVCSPLRRVGAAGIQASGFPELTQQREIAAVQRRIDHGEGSPQQTRRNPGTSAQARPLPCQEERREVRLTGLMTDDQGFDLRATAPAMAGATQFRTQSARSLLPTGGITAQIGESRQVAGLGPLERSRERFARARLARKIFPQPMPQFGRITAERYEDFDGRRFIRTRGERPKQDIALGKLRCFAHGP